MSATITYTFQTLKQEIEDLASLSHGAIELSPGTKQFITAHDYNRGNVRKEGRTLSDIVDRDLSVLELDYYVDGDHVVICTYEEAAVRWQDWWKQYGADLIYRKETSSFALRNRN